MAHRESRALPDGSRVTVDAQRTAGRRLLVTFDDAPIFGATLAEHTSMDEDVAFLLEETARRVRELGTGTMLEQARTAARERGDLSS
jgi:hypothetical protein